MIASQEELVACEVAGIHPDDFEIVIGRARQRGVDVRDLLAPLLPPQDRITAPGKSSDGHRLAPGSLAGVRMRMPELAEPRRIREDFAKPRELDDGPAWMNEIK